MAAGYGLERMSDLEADYEVGVHDGRQPVSDRDCAPPLPGACQGGLDSTFCQIIQGASGFIQQQHGWVFQQGPCECNSAQPPDRLASNQTTRFVFLSITAARMRIVGRIEL